MSHTTDLDLRLRADAEEGRLSAEWGRLLREEGGRPLGG